MTDDAHPLFTGEIGVWNGWMVLDTKAPQALGRVMRENPQGPRIFLPNYRATTPWLLPDGRAPCEERPKTFTGYKLRRPAVAASLSLRPGIMKIMYLLDTPRWRPHQLSAWAILNNPPIKERNHA